VLDGINVTCISLVTIEAVHTNLGMPALSPLLGETRGCLGMALDALLALLDESWTPLIGQSLDDDKCFLQNERDALERSNETKKTQSFA
jgi:hypothetical protein